MEEEKTFNQILEELKQFREEKGISLKQISDQTRINLKLLEELEQGNLEKLPKVYDLYIFKTYLEMIGAENKQQLIDRFNRETGRVPGETTIIRQKKIEAQTEKKLVSNFTVLKFIYISIPLLIILLLVVIFFRNYNPKGNLKESSVKELTAMDIVQAKSPANAVEPTLETPTESDSLKVGVVARDRCWLMYIKDHVDTSDVMLFAENRLLIKADSVVEMRIGNPMAVTLTVGEKQFDQLAGPGEVISYLKVTSDGLVNKRVVKPKRKVAKSDSAETQ